MKIVKLVPIYLNQERAQLCKKSQANITPKFDKCIRMGSSQTNLLFLERKKSLMQINLDLKK